MSTINRVHSFTLTWVWANSRSLAATREILCSLYSSCYYVVSLHRVPSTSPILLPEGKSFNDRWSQVSLDQVSPFGNPRLIAPLGGSSRLNAALHVLHRRKDPRHPPYTLSIFVTSILIGLSIQFSTYCCVQTFLVDRSGFEPLTSAVQMQCSSQLS